MNLKDLKLDFFYLRKALFEYKRFFKYVYNRYFFGKKILKLNQILEKQVNNQDLSIHILTQHKDLIMLIWSLASFYQVMDTIGCLYIHNDGTLTKEDKHTIKRFFPNVKILETENFLADFAQELKDYPVIKKFRQDYQYLKKLIDPYFTSCKKYRLVIDSDLIWFKAPIEIMQEIKNDCQKSFMQENYTINRLYNIRFKEGRMEDKLATKNSGIVLYNQKNFNLEKLQVYFNKIDANYKNNFHFIEQAGYAYCLDNLRSLPADKYIIKEKVDDTTIVRHYTSPRRPLFFIEGLEKIL